MIQSSSSAVPLPEENPPDDYRTIDCPEPDQALKGKALILATRPFASDQPLRSWWHLLSTSALLLGALAVTILLPQLWVRVLASVLSGLFALRLFVIYHDHQHQAILPQSRLADLLMRVFGIWALSPSSIWRSSHNHHHNHNSKLRGSHIGSFPIMTAEAFRKAPRAERAKYLMMRHPLTLLFGYVFVFLYGMCLNPFVTSPQKHWDCLLAILIHGAVAVALAWWGGWTTLLLAQTIPCLILYAIGSYLFYIQHNFPSVVFRDHAGWTYELAALESSSCLQGSPVMHWFTANIGYHHIHHLNARIPFYRLPEAMRSIPELQAPKTTSLHPLEILECLQLKVWDVEKQRMTGC